MANLHVLQLPGWLETVLPVLLAATLTLSDPFFVCAAVAEGDVNACRSHMSLTLHANSAETERHEGFSSVRPRSIGMISAASCHR